MPHLEYLLDSGCKELEQQTVWLALYTVGEVTDLPLADIANILGAENDPGGLAEAAISTTSALSDAAAGKGCGGKGNQYPGGFQQWLNGLLDKVTPKEPPPPLTKPIVIPSHWDPVETVLIGGAIDDEAVVVQPLQDGLPVSNGLEVGAMTGPQAPGVPGVSVIAPTEAELSIVKKGTISMSLTVPPRNSIQSELNRWILETADGSAYPAYMANGFVTKWGEIIAMTEVKKVLSLKLQKAASKKYALFGGARCSVVISLKKALVPVRRGLQMYKAQRRSIESAAVLSQATPTYMKLALNMDTEGVTFWDYREADGWLRQSWRGGTVLFVQGSTKELLYALKGSMTEVIVTEREVPSYVIDMIMRHKPEVKQVVAYDQFVQ